MVSMRGACSPSSVRALSSAFAISARMCMRPAFACSSAWRMISSVMPAILMSICSEVTPLSVPATLKSMSPRWSSSPRMSESTAKLLPSLMRPMAMPATGRLMRHARVHQRQRGAAHGRHRRGAVGFGDLGDHAHRVGELLGRRHQRMHRRARRACRGRSRAGRARSCGPSRRPSRAGSCSAAGSAPCACPRARRCTARPRRCRAWRRRAPASRRG